MQMTYQEFQALSDEGKLKVSMGHLAAVLSTQNSISEEEETELLQTQINRQKALRDVEAVARKRATGGGSAAGRPSRHS